MKKVMPKVGKAIRGKYRAIGVADRVPIFLFLDNAGGHSTDKVVTAYVKMLRDEYNVICIHQRPRSPATNMLDLGVWMALQSVVEKMHHSKRQELKALCNTVMKAWDELDSVKLNNVYERWKMVLDLIMKDDGGDKFVESNRGKLFRAPSREAEDLDEDVARREVNDEALTANDVDIMDMGLD